MINYAWLGLAAACSVAGAGVVTSTFDADAEGWSVNNDADNFAWTSTGGNPGGFVQANDRGQGSIWEFVAPAKFLGDQSQAFGGVLSWDLLQITSPGGDISSEPDATLEGAGLTLVIDAGASPASSWTGFSVALNSSAAWRVNTLAGVLATDAQIQAVLADLTALRLRGEFRNSGGDDAGLDNVRLVPTPGALGVLVGMGGLAAVRRRR